MSEKHILIEGGLLYCSQSVAHNSPATGIPITVTSQTLVDANGGHLVATNKDDSIVNMNFGNCNDPKYRTPPPCQAKVTWSKMHEGVQIIEDQLLMLTEQSEAICNICSIPGKIKIAFHGQQATVVLETMQEADPQIMQNINPLAQPVSINEEKKDGIKIRNLNRYATIK